MMIRQDEAWLEKDNCIISWWVIHYSAFTAVNKAIASSLNIWNGIFH